jgi:hypothetical protein
MELFAQEKQGDIPVFNGKVIFADTIAPVKNRDKFHADLISFLNDSFLKNDSYITVNDTVNNLLVCRIIDYLEIEKSGWSIFAMYMKYTFIIQYQEDKCIVSLRNIHYTEYSEKRDSKDNENAFPAEYVLIEKKYKPAFIKNASEKIAGKTVKRVQEIETSLRNLLE